jgi:hypothetical protein
MRRSLLLSTAAFALAAAPAAAQDPPPADAAPAPADPPQAAPTPPIRAPGRLTLATEADRAVLAGRPFRVAGRLVPAVRGERVVIRVRQGSRKLLAKAVRTDARGRFATRIAVGRAATVAVGASHAASEFVDTAVARAVRIDVLPRRVAAGQRGEAVRLLQRHLARRGYVVGAAGTLDARTARAVLAFRKVTGLPRTTAADTAVMRRLADGGGVFRVRYPGHGKHVEADLSRQVLALIRGRRVERIYHTSSGAPATPTVRGSYRFYLAEPGYNSKEMYYSTYFFRGYAIHGYRSVPVHPASHGCLRVPLDDARSIYDWIALGDRIDVYA